MGVGTAAVAIEPELLELRRGAVAYAGRRERNQRPHEVGEQLIFLAGVRDLVDREFSRLAGVFAATDEYDRQGSSTPIDWVRHHCHMSGPEAVRRVVVGEQLHRLPLASAAVAEGRIGFGHLALMARFARQVESSGALDEASLLSRAEAESVGRFGHTCKALRHAQDPEGMAREEANAVESRELSMSPQEDGLTVLSAVLDNAGAASVATALEGLAARLGKDDHRTRPRRLADALVEMSLFILSGGEGTGTRRAHLSVTCTLDALLGLPGAPAGLLEHGEPISSAALSRLSCDCSITKIMLNDKLIPVGVTKAVRVATRAQRKALAAMYGGCCYPGCNRTPRFCDVHHIIWFSRGGPTVLDNLLLLCAHHHWRVHEGGWVIGLSKDKQVFVIPPQFARGPTPEIAA